MYFNLDNQALNEKRNDKLRVYDLHIDVKI